MPVKRTGIRRLQRTTTRHEDQPSTGLLKVVQENEGDIIVLVASDNKKECTWHQGEVRFSSYGAGNGHSMHTWNALVALMDAIELDNTESPQKLRL